jgi:nucleoid-associated protein YgaU
MRVLRCLLVVATTTAGATGALRLLLPSVTTWAPGFEGALVGSCASAAAGCTLWGWLGALAVVAEALGAADPTPGGARGVAAVPGAPALPAALRRVVLAACGVALSAAAPALASAGRDPQQALPAAVAGLPFPARAMDLPAEAHRVVVVRPGDSLWAITARRLPPDAGDREVSAGWHDLYARNRAVVGADPSLIRPGQELTLPDHLEEQE